MKANLNRYEFFASQTPLLNFYPTAPITSVPKKLIFPFLSNPPSLPLTFISPSSFRVVLYQFPSFFPVFNESFSMDLSLILTDLFIVPYPKNKQKWIKDNTILLPALLPEATITFLLSPTILSVLIFLTHLLKVEPALTAPTSTLAMSLLSRCNLGVCTQHFKGPII